MEYEIYHWGIKGMKWGVRRYQNKDGSLTPAGRKRRAKLEAEMEQLGGKSGSQRTEPDTTPRKKTASEMTDEELRNITNRMQLETNYYNAVKNLAQANPRKVSKGEKFMKGLMNDVVAPAAKSAGKQWLETFLKDKMGLNKEDPIKKLETKVKKLELTRKIKDLSTEDDKSDYESFMKFYRTMSKEDRDELKDAASTFENLNKVLTKGKDSY